MPKLPTPHIEAWYAALRSPAGVCFRTSNFDLARAKLYAARKAAQDPQLDTLSIVQSPTDEGELWIVHSKATPDASQENPA